MNVGFAINRSIGGMEGEKEGEREHNQQSKKQNPRGEKMIVRVKARDLKLSHQMH